VRWRDLPGDRWSYVVQTVQGRRVPVSETLWMRAREVWLHAVDLGSGLWVRDLPEPVLRRLLDDVVGLWARRGEPHHVVADREWRPPRDVGDAGHRVGPGKWGSAESRRLGDWAQKQRSVLVGRPTPAGAPVDLSPPNAPGQPDHSRRRARPAGAAEP
jgi:hypothetical protein